MVARLRPLGNPPASASRRAVLRHPADPPARLRPTGTAGALARSSAAIRRQRATLPVRQPGCAPLGPRAPSPAVGLGWLVAGRVLV